MNTLKNVEYGIKHREIPGIAFPLGRSLPNHDNVHHTWILVNCYDIVLDGIFEWLNFL